MVDDFPSQHHPAPLGQPAVDENGLPVRGDRRGLDEASPDAEAGNLPVARAGVRQSPRAVDVRLNAIVFSYLLHNNRRRKISRLNYRFSQASRFALELVWIPYNAQTSNLRAALQSGK